MAVRVFPELVTGRQDDLSSERWTIEAGRARRGEASCDFVERILQVPVGPSQADRLVRAHELMHVRVSPHDVSPVALYPDVVPRALACAEEFRVNYLVGLLGFDTQELCDGSERRSGEKVAENNDWAEAVYFYVAVLGTGGERPFLLGIGKQQPLWSKTLKVFGKQALAIVTSASASAVSSTQRSASVDAPEGYEQFTVRVARLVHRMAGAQAPENEADVRTLKRSMSPGARRPASGQPATLVFDNSLHYERYAGKVRSEHRRVRSVSGTTPRHVERLLTDPYQRIFSRNIHRGSAVVIIDQSGSMDLDVEAVDALLTAAPGCVVVGYSHRPGDSGTQPNAWVVARGGLRASSIPTGNVGNGVDLPVLEWALRQRRNRSRVIWVTDGQVTDSHDHPCEAIARQCADLVRRHQIALCRDTSEASRLLRKGTLSRAKPQNMGRVGRFLTGRSGM